MDSGGFDICRKSHVRTGGAGSSTVFSASDGNRRNKRKNEEGLLLPTQGPFVTKHTKQIKAFNRKSIHDSTSRKAVT